MNIPKEALQQHVAVLGKTGSGKTFAMKAEVVEPLLAAGKHVCVVDPTGAWWGLRSSRDGKSPGYRILVLGGDHCDLPLPALGGAAVARLLVEQGVSLVADTSGLTVGESARWFTDFASTLYRLNRAPLHLVLDEAHNFAPQGKVPDPETGKMLHAANRLASGGRSRGIRLVMITQRPQKLHKDTLTSADTLVAMRVLAPQDRAAVEDWIKGCGDLAKGKDVLDSLASLQRGEGWVWYPEGGYLRRVKFPDIRTFDSSATPTDGHSAWAPKRAAEIDLTEINKALADAAAEAEANDPKRLRLEIARLRTEAAKRQPSVDLEGAVARARAEGLEEGRATGYRTAVEASVNAVGALLSNAISSSQRNFAPSVVARPTVVQAQKVRNEIHRQLLDAAGLPRGELAVLKAVAQYDEGAARDQISVLTGYKRSSRDAYIQRLKEKGLVTFNGEHVVRTAAGLEALGSNYQPLPTGDELRQYWMNRLPEGERKVLQVLLNRHPNAVQREELDEETGYKRSSRDAYLQRLKARRLVVFAGRGEVMASANLFG